MRYCLNLCRMNFLRWKTSLRILMLLSILAVMQIMYGLPYIESAKGFGYPLQLFETYIAAFSGSHASLLMSIIVVFILADVPIRNTGFESALLRGSRRKWLIGQWLYIFLCSLIVCFVVFLFNVLISVPCAYLPNEWSLPTLITTHSGKSAMGFGQIFSTIPTFILEHDLPVGAMLYTFLLQFLLFSFYGTLAVFLNILCNRIVAPAVLILLNAVHWLLRMFAPGDTVFKIYSWFSPLYHGTYSEHQFLSISEGGMASAAVSAWILLGCSVIFIILSHMAIRKSDILIYTGGDYDG